MDNYELISFKFKNSFDPDATTANKSMGFDPSGINLVFISHENRRIFDIYKIMAAKTPKASNFKEI